MLEAKKLRQQWLRRYTCRWECPLLLGIGAAATILLLCNLHAARFASPAHHWLRQVEPTPTARGYMTFLCGSKCTSPRLLILQTSDGSSAYAAMLDQLSAVQSSYAAVHGFSYVRWDGTVRARRRWTATFNRVYLLSELRQKAQYDWVLLMDPDSVFTDPRLSITRFLDPNYAIIAARGGFNASLSHDINIGVAFFNLRHPDMATILQQWLYLVQSLPDHSIRSIKTRAYVGLRADMSLPNDQDLLQAILKEHPRTSNVVKRYFGQEAYLFNYHNGTYISHWLREYSADPDYRLSRLLGVKQTYFQRMAELTRQQLQEVDYLLARKAARMEDRDFREVGISEMNDDLLGPEWDR